MEQKSGRTGFMATGIHIATRVQPLALKNSWETEGRKENKSIIEDRCRVSNPVGLRSIPMLVGHSTDPFS
jgi:hypothetical protein